MKAVKKQNQAEKSHMALKDVGYLSVVASQCGTAVGRVYAVPKYAVPANTSDVNPFYSARHDVAGRKRPLDLAEFIETAVPLNHLSEASLPEPKHERRVVIMKKRG
jgi:hypothetical protein